MNRKKTAAPENHERWMVSYADFLTLMFAFFVVMFAASQTDKSKAKQVSESVTKALEEGQMKAAVTVLLGGTIDDIGQGNAMHNGPGGVRPHPTPKPILQERPIAFPELLPSLQYLTKELKQEIKEGKLQMRMTQRGLVVSLAEAAFFGSGEETINREAYPTIAKIAAVVAQLPNPVRLEGHSDSIPIHNSRFASNWELSTARGVAMLNLLVERYQISDRRLAVAGYADTMPVESNDTEQGRARNRRVDLVILNKAGYVTETGTESEAAPTGSARSGAAGSPGPPSVQRSSSNRPEPAPPVRSPAAPRR
jgi:chemotaxis protein MotB